MKKLLPALLCLAMLLTLAVPAMASGEPSEDPLAPVTFPDDAKIVSATAYTSTSTFTLPSQGEAVACAASA